jgi:hypothetical protein
MTIYTTRQGCKVETTYAIMLNGAYQENVTLSVDPLSSFALAADPKPGREIPSRTTVAKMAPRFRR